VFPGVPLQDGYNLNRLMNNDPGDPNGPVTLIQATALSINCAFLRLAHQVSLPKVIEVAKSMGLSDPTLNPSNPSLVIGTETVRPIEMAAAYATVADGGIYHAPTFVNRVVDRNGNLIYNGERPGRRVFSAQVAAEAVLALQATVQYGTGTAAALANADVAGKTGTTENSVDAWFNGITPTLVSSVWIGDPNGELPMYVDGVEVYGADYPTEIWHDVMAYALSTTPYAAFPAPAPYLMPPLEFIDSPTLEEDDLISHGGIGPGDCVWNGTLVPCVTTTIPVATTAGSTTTTTVPASTTAPGSTPGTTTSSASVPGAGGPGATTPGLPTPGSVVPGAITPGSATQGTATQGTTTLTTAVPPGSSSTSAFTTPSGASGPATNGPATNGPATNGATTNGAATNGAASPTSAVAPTSSPTSAVAPSSTVAATGQGQGQVQGGGPGPGRSQYSQVGP
jgi:membrane peptidoglycan carboxypeptidase